MLLAKATGHALVLGFGAAAGMLQIKKSTRKACRQSAVFAASAPAPIGARIAWYCQKRCRATNVENSQNIGLLVHDASEPLILCGRARCISSSFYSSLLRNLCLRMNGGTVQPTVQEFSQSPWHDFPYFVGEAIKENEVDMY